MPFQIYVFGSRTNEVISLPQTDLAEHYHGIPRSILAHDGQPRSGRRFRMWRYRA